MQLALRQIETKGIIQISNMIGERIMKSKYSMASLCLLFALLAAPAAQAQLTLDLAKITCKQFLIGEIGTPRLVASWVSGYFNGEKGNTVLTNKTVKESVEKVSTYCRKHYAMPVIEAARSVLGNQPGGGTR